MNKKYNYIVSIIVSLITSLLVIPIRANGNLTSKNYYGRTTVFELFLKSEKVCTNCYNIKVIWPILILEILFIFIISLVIFKVIDKRRK